MFLVKGLLETRSLEVKVRLWSGRNHNENNFEIYMNYYKTTQQGLLICSLCTNIGSFEPYKTNIVW